MSGRTGHGMILLTIVLLAGMLGTFYVMHSAQSDPHPEMVCTGDCEEIREVQVLQNDAQDTVVYVYFHEPFSGTVLVEDNSSGTIDEVEEKQLIGEYTAEVHLDNAAKEDLTIRVFEDDYAKERDSE